MNSPEQLRAAILARLARVIDPETGVDIVRMRLIEDLTVDEQGRVSYTFRPSSPLSGTRCGFPPLLSRRTPINWPGSWSVDCPLLRYLKSAAWSKKRKPGMVRPGCAR